MICTYKISKVISNEIMQMYKQKMFVTGASSCPWGPCVCAVCQLYNKLINSPVLLKQQLTLHSRAVL